MHSKVLVGITALMTMGVVGCNKDDAGDSTPDAATCFPTTCVAQGKNCGSIMDGCGSILECGSCTVPDTCGGGGSANVCGNGLCTPTNCVAEGASCGNISDGCASVLDCGSCVPPAVCGGGGVANTCGVPSVVDAGTLDPDAGSSGNCDPTCMAQSGAVCCKECGCTGTVLCYPVCESPYQWDCEIGCCYDYNTQQCM
jgi:hypothetical protein